MRCGVDTAMSTPQVALNIHWFFGWLTRAMTRGTANSCLARSDTTRLSSSSPVAATTTSHALEPGFLQRRDLARVADEHLEPATCRQLGRDVRVALDEQHLVAVLDERVRDEPADASCARDRDAHQWWHRVVLPLERACSASSAPAVDHEVEDVALLADEVGLDDPGGAEPGDRRDREAAGLVQLRELLPGPRRREVALDEGDLAAGVGPVRPGARRGGGAGPPGRSSTRRWRRSGCRAAGRSRHAGGRRCGRRPGRPRRSRGRRAPT